MPEGRPEVNERWHRDMRVAARILHTSNGALGVTHVSFREFGVAQHTASMPIAQFLAEGWQPLGSFVGRLFRLRQPDANNFLAAVIEDGFDRIRVQVQGIGRTPPIESTIQEFLQHYETMPLHVVRAQTPFGEHEITVAAELMSQVISGTINEISMGTAVPYHICSNCGERHRPGACEDPPQGSQVLAALQGSPVAMDAPQSGQVLSWDSAAMALRPTDFTSNNIQGFSEKVIASLGLDEETASRIRAKYLPPKPPAVDPPDIWERLLADDDE